MPNRKVSFSQYQMWKDCPHRWKLQYKDGINLFSSTIHTCFGTAIHETLQHYLTTMFEINGAQADELDIEEYFKEKFGDKISIDYAPPRLGDVRKTHADISSISNDLGYSPTINFWEGLRRTIEWWKI